MFRGLKYFIALNLFLISICGIVEAREGRQVVKNHGQEWLPGTDYGQDMNVLNEELRRLKQSIAGVTQEFVVDAGDTVLIQDGNIINITQ